VYFNDWPDRYIHTTRDVPANIDPTKLQRAALLAAATTWYLASLSEVDVPALLTRLEASALRRAATALERRGALDAAEAANLTRHHLAAERALLDSVERFAALGVAGRARRDAVLRAVTALLGTPAPAGPARGAVYARNPEVKGPMSAFGYEYLPDKLGAEATGKLALPKFDGARADGGVYAYEALNLVDGTRDVGAIRDALSAAYGPVPEEQVAEYLRALASIDVIREVRR
jgi:aminopeptidase YwaD